MTRRLAIHGEDPQLRLLRQAAQSLLDGAVLVVPTDASYALVARLGDADALRRLRAVRGFGPRHHLTLLCRDLTDIGHYARLDNAQYRLVKSVLPGPYTFVLQASRELPRRVLHETRKTIGVRISAHPVVQALLTELGEPLASATLILPGEEVPVLEIDGIQRRLSGRVELIIDSGDCPGGATTVVDLTQGEPHLLRAGLGDLSSLGL